MPLNSSRALLWRLVIAAPLVLALACQGDVLEQSSDDVGVDAAPADLSVFPDGYTPPGTDMPVKLVISPANPTVTVESGKATPTVQFTVTLGKKKVSASWRLEQGEFGNLSASGLFTPSGKLGGLVKVTAQAGNLKADAALTVKLKMVQNGTTKANGNPGPGGFGGVGGEGLGPAVDAATVKLLDGTPTAPGAMKLLYPYDKTVWPLGILAPLVQWSGVPQGSGDAVAISLTASHFQFKGTFGRPKALAAGAALRRHPIPQDVWKAATRTAAGAKLVLRVIVASKGKAYGPLVQTWIVAGGALKGTVYYQSYGTDLAKNYTGAKGGDGTFGGATLAIKGGSTDPTLVAGKTGGKTACRVCHSVNARGTRMVVQHGDNYKATSSYDLLKGYAEKVYPAATIGKLGWVGMTPDGALGLGNAAPIPGGANTSFSALYDMNTGTEVTATGLKTFVTSAGFPMFAPDGKRVAFTFTGGPGNSTIGAGDGNKLVVMDFAQGSKTFSNPRLLYKGATGSRPGWPAFWPTGKGLVFQRELTGNAKEYFATRYGGRGDLYWVDLASGKTHPLTLLNGNGYLPIGPSKHDKDWQLAYEPTVSPIASGGYAWVVFVSRRLYGNVATIDPWSSDPREYDHTKAPTCKKLWVAALDLNPKPGADPSHPAFYLPAQELMAGNSRGFWVIDPCKPDGKPCQGGDECCNGFCSKDPKTANLVCGKFGSKCAKEYDKCKQSVDCCDYPKLQCVNGYCARWKIN